MWRLTIAASLAGTVALPISPATPPTVLAAHSLRGSEVAASPAPASASPSGAPAFPPPPAANATVVTNGDFYKAEGCDECSYKADQCGCQPAVEYLACVTANCHPSKHPKFADMCVGLRDKCTSDLNIDCSGPDTACESKWNQLPTGGLGLSVNINKDNGFCGPFGKCLGHITMNVDVHNRPVLEPISLAASAAEPAAAAPVAPIAVATLPVFLECGLPAVSKPDMAKKSDWKLCQVEVKGPSASCKMSLFKELQAGGERQAYCVLTDGENGKRLTQPYWSMIINTHDKQEVKEVKEVAKEANKPEAAKAPKPEAAKERVKAKPEAPEKKSDKAPAQKEKKWDEVSIAPRQLEKLPWMVEKEKREAAEAEAAKKAPADKKEEKKEEKKPEAKSSGNEEGKLPWMKGVANDKAKAPGVDAVLPAQ